mmetsp:Transcript_8052/g.20042  ORF Transcript_8052/g.20042 Transcript_8052/m.20042 type:complete len:891 (-) Transcript_8052:55-2727(-)
MFLNLVLLFRIIPLVRSTDTGTSELLSIAKKTPFIPGIQCTSRTLRTSSTVDSFDLISDSTNLTVNDDGFGSEDESTALPDIFPYCPEGYFCDLSGNENITNMDHVQGLCKPCAGNSNNCPSSIDSGESAGSPNTLAKAVLEECQNQCGVEKNTCSSTRACPSGLFCNFENSGQDGYCEECPPHLFLCSAREEKLTSEGLTSCQSICAVMCEPPANLKISKPATAEKTGESISSPIVIEDVKALIGSPQISSTGPVADCGLGLEPCEGVEGSICFIERGKAPFLNKTRNCQAGGGIGVVLYNLEAICENFNGTYFGEDTYIPAVSLTHLDGKNILNEAKAMPPETPLLVTIDVGGRSINPLTCAAGCTKEFECEGTDTCNFNSGEFGECTPVEFKAVCNQEANYGVDHMKCLGEREFCDFKYGKRGECSRCPEDFDSCFFSNLNSLGAEECNAVCNDGNANNIKAAPCKFCQRGTYTLDELSDGFYSLQEDVTEPCEFCASTTGSKCYTGSDRWDMKYPERTIPILGTEVKCWLVAEFYKSLNIKANTVGCDSARAFNYICGCSDTPGYAGAKSDSKMIALVWCPRIGAILSILGSSLMILTVLQDEEKRKKVIGQLIIFLCGFDIIGSVGYALASYPTPKEHYIYGAKGNMETCTAQGFFIQIGTISLYMNVSVAFYYLLIIKFSWREHSLKKSWFYKMLFAIPVSIGAIFAFAGIPFYNNAILWCNNSWIYWSEIPVIIAIGIATIIMIDLCWFVFKSERASRRFRRHSREERNSLSKPFFLQSLVYLGAFYLTWPPYLALQIMIANGSAFSNYPFMLWAGTAVTLQGFWNYVFHVGLRNQNIGNTVKSAWRQVKSRTGSLSFYPSKSKRWTRGGGVAVDPTSNAPAL